MKDLVLEHVLIVGVDEIDDDHRRLTELFNLLNHSLAQEDPPDYLAAILEELINCTIWHFSHEERLMLKYGYTAYAEHRQEHQDLIESVRQLQRKLQETGTLVSTEDLEFLEHWLTEHILAADMKLGSYLAKTM